MTHVTRKVFESTAVPLPPLEEQKRIAAILNEQMAAVEKAKKAAEGRLEAAKALPAAYLRDVFEGEESEDWPFVTLDSFCSDVRYGTSNKSQEDGILTLRIPNIVRGFIDISDLKRVPVQEKEIKTLKLEDGDLLFIRTNGSQGNVGKTVVFDREQLRESGHHADEFIFASYLIRVRLNSNELMPNYVQTYLQTNTARTEILDRCKTTAGQFNLNSVGIKSLSIPIPSIDIQRSIVSQHQERLAGVQLAEKSIQHELETIQAMPAAILRKAFAGEL
jgi:type I restriction enzyme S subunit